MKLDSYDNDLEQSDAPLLSEVDSNDNEKTTHLSPAETSSLKRKSVICGSIIAFLSQLILSQCLWDEHILQKSTVRVLIFSLLWSFWTCAMVFSAMVLLVRSLNVSKRLSDDLLFQLEAHHMAGALASITVTWLLNDIFHIHSNFLNNPVHQWLVVAATFGCYCVFVGWILYTTQSCVAEKNRTRGEAICAESSNTYIAQASMFRTLEMIASIAGLLVGACSQFLLASMFWNAQLHQPAIAHVMVFSVSWSMITVILTAMGCYLLRFLIGSSEDTVGNSDCHNTCFTNDTTGYVFRQRIQLRMEAYYVSCTLVGICMAWIFMDIFLDMTEQIAPSMAMLALSMVVFRAILCCFPEEKCVEDYSQEIADL